MLDRHRYAPDTPRFCPASDKITGPNILRSDCDARPFKSICCVLGCSQSGERSRKAISQPPLLDAPLLYLPDRIPHVGARHTRDIEAVLAISGWYAIGGIGHRGHWGHRLPMVSMTPMRTAIQGREVACIAADTIGQPGRCRAGEVAGARRGATGPSSAAHCGPDRSNGICFAAFSVYSNLKPCAWTDKMVDLPQVTSCGPGPVSLPGAFMRADICLAGWSE